MRRAGGGRLSAALAGIALVSGGLSATPAAAVSVRVPGLSGYAPAVVDAAAGHLGKGLTRADAVRRLASQPARIRLGERLLGQLGARAAGMWLDQADDTVVVNVVDEASAATVRAAGGKANLVARSMIELESIRDGLRAGQPADTAIGIDVRANQVVVRIGARAGAAGLMARAARNGSAVRVEHLAGSFQTTIFGGDPIAGGNIRCSLGFHTTGFTFGGSSLTAGHCARIVPFWFDVNANQYYGSTIGYSFPGNDFGLIRAENGLPRPGEVNLYGGGSQDIVDAIWPYDGEFVFKSGSTTGLTWGTVLATGVTICLPEGCVDGLAASDAPSDRGDSGGPWFDGPYAVGLSSAIGGGLSYFQPVVEALQAFGVWVY